MGGREYFDQNSQRVVEVEPLPPQQRELIDDLHRRLMALCTKPENSKFLGIGSGLQRKFGELTMARNDPAGTVPELESRRFMGEVRQVKDLLDKDGIVFDMHDTLTDMEIFPRLESGRPSFDKGDGVTCLDRKLNLEIGEGPNVVCGDTSSDIKMIEATLELMKAHEAAKHPLLVDSTTSVIPAPSPAGRPDSCNIQLESVPSSTLSSQHGSFGSFGEPPRFEANHLVVLFVVSPEQHARTPQMAEKVQKLCAENGAHCALIPSPDVLVAALEEFSKEHMPSRKTSEVGS